MQIDPWTQAVAIVIPYLFWEYAAHAIRGPRVIMVEREPSYIAHAGRIRSSRKERPWERERREAIAAGHMALFLIVWISLVQFLLR